MAKSIASLDYEWFAGIDDPDLPMPINAPSAVRDHPELSGYGGGGFHLHDPYFR